MNIWMKHLMTPLAAITFLSGCAAGALNTPSESGTAQLARKRAAYDMECPAAQIQLINIDGGRNLNYGAVGCGKRAAYVILGSSAVLDLPVSPMPTEQPVADASKETSSAPPKELGLTAAGVSKRASFDLNCPESRLDLQDLGGNLNFGVRGCGKKAVYVVKGSGPMLNSAIESQ